MIGPPNVPAAADAVARVTDKADSVLSRTLFSIGGTPVSSATLITVGVVLLLTLLVAKLAERVVVRLLRTRGKAGEGEIKAIKRVVRYVTWLAGATFALSAAGINLTALFAAGALFAVAIGFAMQNIAENFVSGVILLLERAIKPGDVLELDGHMVRVAHMGIRTTIARTLDDEDLVVPNSKLVQSSVKNYTLRDPHYRVRARIGVSYSSDLEVVKAALERAAAAMEWRLEGMVPRVLLLEFGASSVDWEVSVWTDDPWRLRSRRSELLLAAWSTLHEASITIAFPQLDVHLDAALVRALDRCEPSRRGERTDSDDSEVEG